MSEYNWCHNPDCHTIETQSRIRGTGDNKVLRTVKIKMVDLATGDKLQANGLLRKLPNGNYL